MTEKVIKSAMTAIEKHSILNVKEVLEVLKHQPIKMMSWGTKDLKNLNNKGLIFKVNGNLHKGCVLISLSYNDTFQVDLINVRGRITETITDVYVDNLVDVIDEKIERISIYKD